MSHLHFPLLAGSGAAAGSREQLQPHRRRYCFNATDGLHSGVQYLHW